MNKDNGWDASASWNGYMYQGKVALLLTLRNINAIGDASGYWLESEGIEDFSIGLGEDYLTIHQVKNRKDEKIENYGEALSNIVKRIKDYPNIENGYLHVKTQIKTDDWKKDIEKQLLNYYPEKIQQIQKILENSDVFNNTYNEILEKWNEEKNVFNRNTKNIYKMIMSQIEKENNLEKKTDITIDLFKSATEQVCIDEKENYNVIKTEEVIKKIELYDYADDNSSEEAENKLFASSSEIRDMALEEIEKYWGDTVGYRIEKREIYYMKLLDLINDNITERAEKGSTKIKILFEEFENILNKKSDEILKSTMEEELLRLKYLYMREKEEFCTEENCLSKSEESCDSCKLEEISNVILQYSLPELEIVFRIMALHQTGKLTEQGFELFNKSELETSFFPGITEIDKEFFLSEYKVLCQIQDKFMLATTIDAERPGRKKKTIEGLIQNNIQDVCQNIIYNDEYDTTLMEIDKLITRNFDSEDIFAEACKIDIITEQDESETDKTEQDKLEDKLKYMKITRTKKVGLISVERAKQEYGERK